MKQSDQPILFVDLDRTLIDTTRFAKACWQAIAAHFGIDFASAMAVVPDYYVKMGNLQYYDFERHIEDTVHLPPKQVKETIRPYLREQHFAYDDANELASWQRHYDVRILSFGGVPYQTYKLSFMPDVDGVSADITLQPKGEYITQHYPGRHGWLVDDKHNGDMPPGFQEIRLNRLASQPFTRQGSIVTINSLKYVEEALTI